MGVMNFRHRADSEIKERPEGYPPVDRYLISILPHEKKSNTSFNLKGGKTTQTEHSEITYRVHLQIIYRLTLTTYRLTLTTLYCLHFVVVLDFS